MADYAVRGDVVRELRNRKLLTQKRLAERAGVSKQTITRMETGTNVAQFETIEKVARALDVDPSALIEYRADSRMTDENISKVEEAQREWESRSKEGVSGREEGARDVKGRGT